MQMGTPDNWRFKGTYSRDFQNYDDGFLPSGGTAAFYPFNQKCYNSEGTTNRQKANKKNYKSK